MVAYSRKARIVLVALWLYFCFSLPVYGTDGEVILLHSTEKYENYVDSFAIPVLGNLDEIVANLEKRVQLNGSTCSLYSDSTAETQYPLQIYWDSFSVDTEIPGLHRMLGFLLPSEGMEFAEGFEPDPFYITLSIQDAGEPDINACFEEENELRFPWIELSCDPSEVTVWFREENGKWEELVSAGLATCSKNELKLSKKAYRPGVTYQLLAEYPGGSTKTLTFIYEDNFTIKSMSEIGREEGESDPGEEPSVERDGGGSSASYENKEGISFPQIEITSLKQMGKVAMEVKLILREMLPKEFIR